MRALFLNLLLPDMVGINSQILIAMYGAQPISSVHLSSVHHFLSIWQTSRYDYSGSDKKQDKTIREHLNKSTVQNLWGSLNVVYADHAIWI